jgi:hypothetical protein
MSPRKIASAVVAAVWFWPALACESPYTFGDCGGTDDCYEGAQNIPGTICKDSQCKCQIPDQVICCHFREVDNPDCKRACRYCWECGEGAKGCEDVEVECRDSSDCPAKAGVCDIWPSCEVGRCVYRALGGDAKTQKLGDCERRYCLSGGGIELIPDLGDIEDDGNDCTVDQCWESGPTHSARPDGSGCAGGRGYCIAGKCVECMYQNDCATTGSEVCSKHKCVPSTCIDDLRSGAETDIDCGGPCAPCNDGKKCVEDADCGSGACTGGKCAAPTTRDGRANGSESGVDCGGPDAKPCGDGARCAVHADCSSDVCLNSTCQAPSCRDGTKNGKETGVDCGGDCSIACE